jgi:hypothetical protein
LNLLLGVPTKKTAVTSESPKLIVMDPKQLIDDFLKVAALARRSLCAADILVEVLKAPHRPPTQLPPGKMAVYLFSYGPTVLKIGKAGPKSNARYTSHHYRAGRAPSTLAASLVRGCEELGIGALTNESVGDWIKTNTDRLNFILKTECGVPTLTLLESFLHCRLNPCFESFESQRT